MKCPKCSYLGFESGARCRNCGYDFSLSAAASDPIGDVASRGAPTTMGRSTDWMVDPAAATTPVPPAPSPGPLAPLPLDTLVAVPPRVAVTGSAPRAPRQAGRAAARSLPLFQPDDEPLVKLPASPRAPLAVRRTPERPRRATPRAVRRPIEPPAPVLPIVADPLPERADHARPTVEARPSAVTAAAATAKTSTDLAACGVARRLAAASLDHGLLFAIDAAVVYFTLKMAGLATADWLLLPPVPLASFLLLVKAAYFSAFTMVGGQTIGKMAVGIRVVAEDGSSLEPTRALRRTLVGAVSMLAAGAGLVPLVVGADGRGFHDRVARTRVIALPSGRRTA